MRDPLRVLEDLRRERVLLRRHVPGLLEQRHVDHRRRVAHRARVAVPVPRAAEVAAALDDADVVDAGLLQPRAGDEAGEAAADDRDRDLVDARRALDRRDVRVVEEVGEPAGRLEVLVVAVGPQPLVALLAVLRVQRRRVDQQSPSSWISLDRRRGRSRR